MTTTTPWKYAVVSDEIASDFTEVVKLSKQLGFEQVALNKIWGKQCPELSSEELSRVRKLLDEEGLTPSAFGTLLFKALRLDDPDFDTRVRAELETFRESCELAKLVGAPMVRIFTFRRPEADQEPWAITPEGGVLDDSQIERIAGILAQAADIAGESGLLVGLENVRSCFGNTGEHTAAIVAAIGRDNVKVVWDPANHYISCGRDVLDGYHAVKSSLLSIDFKNATILDLPTGKTVWSPIGEGDIDFGHHLETLVKANYQGNATVETHWRGPGLPAAVATAFTFGQLRVLAAKSIRAAR